MNKKPTRRFSGSFQALHMEQEMTCKESIAWGNHGVIPQRLRYFYEDWIKGDK